MKIDYERLISDIILFVFFAVCDITPLAWGIVKITESNRLYNECKATKHEVSMFACWDYRQAVEGWCIVTAAIGVICLMFWFLSQTLWTKLLLKTVKQLLSKVYKLTVDKVKSDYSL